jgi:hypothetical protein
MCRKVGSREGELPGYHGSTEQGDNSIAEKAARLTIA